MKKYVDPPRVFHGQRTDAENILKFVGIPYMSLLPNSEALYIMGSAVQRLPIPQALWRLNVGRNDNSIRPRQSAWSRREMTFKSPQRNYFSSMIQVEHISQQTNPNNHR